MNLKKIMIALSAALMLWCCSDDNESTNGGNATISLSTNIIQVDRNGGNATVTVTSSDNWRLSGVYDWVHPSVTSGNNGDIVTFTIDPNTIVEKRTATFKFFSGSSVIPLQVESEHAYIIDLLSAGSLPISKDEKQVQIELNTNVAEPIIAYSEGSTEWLTFNKRSDFGGKTILSFNAAENKMYKDRSATITISSPLVAKPVIVSVNQKQTDAIIPESNTLKFDLAARTISCKVRYNVDYAISVTQGADWITHQSASEPQTCDDGLSIVTLTYDLAAASATRGGTIHIAGETENVLTSDIIVVQKSSDVELAEIPDNNLRSLCIKNNWVLSLAGSQCIILEAGLNATSLSNKTSASSQISDLTGIENFPNLTSLTLNHCTNMKKLDISGLHKVSSLSFKSTGNCEEFNLGDNPITSFDSGLYVPSTVESLKISSSKLNSIILTLSSYYEERDKVTSIDVSECPALTTLNADRSKKVKTLYLKTGQVIPNLTKNDATTIVYK